MNLYVKQDYHSIDIETRKIISARYKRITKAINQEFWGSSSETAHSRYVGSYGRGTAISTSDLDVLHVLPDEEYIRFTSISGNGPSRLLQAIKKTILTTYPTTNIKGDGQVAVVSFHDGIRFEILPAFQKKTYLGWDGTYKYPDTHMGGNWLSTNPITEQEAMKQKNGLDESNGLLFDTCKHIRYIRDSYYSCNHLSGILIDAFVYHNIGNWHWAREGEVGKGAPAGTYEQSLLDKYNNSYPFAGFLNSVLQAPGSGMQIDTIKDWAVLGKVLRRMV